LPFESGDVQNAEPPCNTCRPEDPFPENLTAFEVWGRCGDEWITAGMDGIRIAIPSQSIEAAMNITGLWDKRERQEVYDRVKRISRVIVAEINKERAKRANDES